MSIVFTCTFIVAPILLIIIMGIIRIVEYNNDIATINSCPTITFKDFLKYYNASPEKWSHNEDFSGTLFLHYYNNKLYKIYFTCEREEKKFKKWLVLEEKAKSNKVANEKLTELKKQWNKDLLGHVETTVDSLQKQLNETEAARKYWEDAYNEVMKGQK